MPPPRAGHTPLVGGLELGGSKAVCAVGTGPGDLRAEARLATTSPAATLAAALEFLAEQHRREPLAAVGIAAFGPLDLDPRSPTHGHLTTTPKAGWAGVDLVEPLRRGLGVSVAIDTDVNAAALAEHRWGAGQDADPLVYVTVGTGIGGGALVRGVPLHGLGHPEMGHVRVPRDRMRDPFDGVCPYHGDCLEGLASGPALGARWGAPAESLAPEHPAWALEADYLALGLQAIAAVLAPRRIVMGGGVMRAPGLLARVRAALATSLAGYVPAPELVAPALGERAGVLGAIALGRDLVAGRGSAGPSP